MNRRQRDARFGQAWTQRREQVALARYRKALAASRQHLGPRRLRRMAKRHPRRASIIEAVRPAIAALVQLVREALAEVRAASARLSQAISASRPTRADLTLTNDRSEP